MRNKTPVSTGVEWIDQLLGQLRIGENVVWEVEAGTAVEIFMRVFLETNVKSEGKSVYVSFNHSPVTMKEKLGALFDEPDFLLLDCFTDGKGKGDTVFARFYEIGSGEELSRVIRVPNPASIEDFSKIVNEIEMRAGERAKYVFDSLTGMQDLWGEPSRAFRFFSYACPRLYDLRTIAYWILEKEAHTPSFRANLRHVTQVAIELSRSRGHHTLQVLKAEGRALGAEGEEPQRYETDGRTLRLVADARRELSRLGKMIRQARVKRGFSQVELGEILGVTASTVSQAENGLISLSLTNLFTLTRELELNLGQLLGEPVMHKEPVSIMREKDRPRVPIAGGRRKSAYVESLQEVKANENLACTILVMPPGTTLKKHFSLRKGVEFGLMLSGELEVEVAGGSHLLRSGDSICLEQDTPAGWANAGNEEARMLWVVAEG